jgi:hypothetical protein
MEGVPSASHTAMESGEVVNVTVSCGISFRTGFLNCRAERWHDVHYSVVHCTVGWYLYLKYCAHLQ